MSRRKKIKSYFKLLGEAGKEFIADNVIKLSSSLAYYTIFSIGPLLLVMISLTGLFVAPDQITGRVRQQIEGFVGSSGTEQIFSIIQNLQNQNAAQRFSIIGIVILIFGATGVFADIQDSIN